MNPAHRGIDPEVLAALVPLNGLAPDQRAELAAHADVVSLPEGETFRPDDDAAGYSYYLLTGAIDLALDGETEEAVRAGTEDARYSLTLLNRPGASAVATATATLIRVERAKVSTMLIWTRSAGADTSPDSPDTGKWMQAVLRSAIFSQIPPANLDHIYEHLEPIPVSEGEMVIRQGDPGDYYYIVREGHCRVWHQSSDASPPIPLAELSEGDGFGEEALVSNARRNASVSMLTDGVLLRMTKTDFIALISDPLLNYVDDAAAEAEVEAGGARWLDVRLPEEHAKNGFPGSINVPLAELRDRVDELDRDSRWMVYCNSGRRSAAAAFLLRERGYDTRVLGGGLLHEPSAMPTPVVEIPDSAALHSQLAVANAELEIALQHSAELDVEREIAHDAQLPDTDDAQALATEREAELEAQANQARATLEAAKRRKLELEASVRKAEAQANSQRVQAEARIEQLRKEAENRLAAERKRLEEQYSGASARMEQLRRQREAAETRFAEEKKRLEAELEDARRKLEKEAQRIRDEMTSFKRDTEARVENIRSEQRSQEEQVRGETESRLLAERRQIETEIAKTVAAQEKARSDLEHAESARESARGDAERLAAEFEASQREKREELERRRIAEQQLAQERAAKARAKLEQAEKACKEAEQARSEFTATIVDFDDAAKPDELEGTVRSELEEFEANIARAAEQVDTARRAQQEAERNQQVVEERAALQRAKEEELRLQLCEEMEDWLQDERKRSEEELDEARRQEAELDEVKAKKAAQKRADRAQANDLLSDIASQLGGGDDDDESVTESQTIRRTAEAEQQANLTQEALDEAAERKRKAREALERAKAQISRLKVQHEEV